MMDLGSLVIEARRSLPEIAALAPGDRLRVKVVEVYDHQRALVELGRWRVLADIGFPAAAGDELQVRVVESGARLRLQRVSAAGPPALAAAMAAGSEAAVDAPRPAAVRTGPLADALQRLTAAGPLPVEVGRMADALRLFLAPLDPRSDPAALAARLRELCQESGVFLEQRLGAAVTKAGAGAGEPLTADTGSRPAPEGILATDLKARLLVLKAYLESAAGRQLAKDRLEMAGLTRAAAEVLADIRAGQEALAQPGPQASGLPVVHLALPMPADGGRAGLKIAFGRRSAAGREQGHRAAILLELDRMGAVRADLTLAGNRLAVAVFVSRADLRELVDRHASELCDALAPFFEQVAFHVSVSSRKIARFASEELRPGNETRVDVRV
jgi:hypothetical protein